MEATKASQSFFVGQGQMSKVTACLSEEQCALSPSANDCRHGGLASRKALHMQPVTPDGVARCLPDR